MIHAQNVMRKLKFRIEPVGIKVEISFWFMAICCLYSFLFEGAADVFLAVLLHECSHCFVIYILGSKVSRLRLTLTDITINSEIYLLAAGKQMIVHLAGPAANFVAAVIADYYGNTDFFAVNLVMGLFQLLPVNSSDGGSLLALMLKAGNPAVVKGISLSLSVLILLSGCVLLAYFRNSYSLLIAGLYILFMTCK